MAHLSTGQVADLLHVPVHRLAYLTRDRQLRPVKGPTGAFAWSFTDVQRAARLLGVGLPSQAAFDAVREGRRP
jgi:hypothetical protein